MTHRLHQGKPTTKDVTTHHVLKAAVKPGSVVSNLIDATGCHRKVAINAIWREAEAGMLTWAHDPTDKGLATLADLDARKDPYVAISQSA